jgi:membrane protein
VLKLIKRAFSNFLNDRCQSMAAALAYYTAFSLPPLLLLLMLMLGAIVDRETLETGIQSQLGGLMGPSGAAQIEEIIRQGKDNGNDGFLPTLLSILALAFGATGVFGELQAALNTAWKVAPDPKSGGLKSFIVKRILSFGMVLGIAFVLLVSLALSAMISAFGQVVSNMFNQGLSPAVMFTFDLLLSFIIFTGVFGGIFKFLPDARINWKDVEVGAIGTTILFLLGKFVIGFYLGQSNPGEAFGAAGSLAVLLVWVYYSSMILLFGAEFTCVWAEQRGGGIRPEPGAIRTDKPGAVAPRHDPEDTRLHSQPPPEKKKA